MSLQVSAAPQRRYKDSIIVQHVEKPRCHGLGIYVSNESWLSVDNLLHKALRSPTSLTTTFATLSPAKSSRTSSQQQPNKLSKVKSRLPPEHDTIRVWDSTQKDQEFGKGLQIHRLAGGIGVAVTGHYRQGARAGQVRYDAFMAHLVEGRMRDTLKALLSDVEHARKKGFVVVKTTFCYRDEKTLNQDQRMIWSSRMVIDESKLRERLVQMAENSLGDAPDLHPYHVLSEKAMSITGPDRTVKIWDI